MRTDTSPTRTPGLSATTTLVALMAMATACSAAAGPTKSSHAPAECRTLIIVEGQSVRHVAAAVAAIARDLFGSDHVDVALGELAWTDQYLPMIESWPAFAPEHGVASSPPLIEHLLDLPPPTC